MKKDYIEEKLVEFHLLQLEDKSIEIKGETEICDIGLDSLGITELIVNIEEEFDVVLRMDDMANFKTINDMVDYIEKEINA